MKISDLLNNENLNLSPGTWIGIKMLELHYGDREIDLDYLDKQVPGIKEILLKGE